MAKRFVIFDTLTGKREILKNLWIDQDFEVSSPSGQTDFVTSFDLTSDNKMDVFIDGILTRDTLEYTRNDSLNTVSFTYAVPENSWVRIRIYLVG